MKKHFLLLLLMTLLPLAGWAAHADLITKPTLATGLTYDGTAQALITGSFNLPSDYETSVGGVLWAVTTTDAAPGVAEEGVAFANVKATDAGSYWVWYKVLKDNDQYLDDGDWTQIGTTFVRISKASLGFEAATPATGLVYDGTAQALFTANATAADFATIQYSIWDTTLETPAWSDWKTDVTAFKGTDAGSYSVKWEIANWDEIHLNLADGTVYSGTFDDVVIASADITAEIDGTPAFTFNGQEQKPTIIVKSGETTLTADTDYEITYWTDETRNTTQVATPTDAKTYYILVSGINNYAGAGPGHNVATLSYAIGKKSLADEDVTAVVKNDYINKTYKGEAIAGYVPANLTVKAYVGTDNELTLGSSGYDRTGYENNIDVPAANATDDQKPRFKVVGKGNFTGERYVYFNIVPRSLNDVTISADLVADQPYTGLQITPTTEGKITYNTQTLVEGEDKDFTVAYGLNKNVVKEEGVVVNGGTITITGKGNYKDEVVKNFKITPAVLTVNAKNFSKNLGTVDPTSDELVAGNYYEITGYVNETDETAGVTGAPTFAIADHPETTGTHAGVISISAVTGLSAANSANYSFVAGAAANLIIGQGSVTVAATATEETYGYKLPTLDKDAFGFTATGLNGAETITALTFTVKDANDHEYEAGDMLEAGEYTITPSAATATSDSYVFEYTPATLTINPYKLTIAAQDQAIDYGTAPVVCPTSWANTYVKFLDADGNLIGKTAFEALYGVWKEDFIENTEWVVADNHPLAEPGTIKVNLKGDYDDKNFEVEIVEGIVTYNALGGLVLTSTDADLAKIEAENGNAVNVKIDFSLRNNRAATWKADTWATMTLPFDISVADLSKKLGYAVVNVIDPKRTEIDGTSSKFYGKLTMKGGNGNDEKLAANKPFMVKTADAITGIVDFGTQTIIAPATDADLSVDADENDLVKFTGTYTTKTVKPEHNKAFWFMTGSNSKWLYIGSQGSWDILPFEGFLDLSGLTEAQARNMTFVFEEIDGSTTAIKGISTDDLNNKNAEGWYNLKGMKMDGAPLQKGIYIKNGKKVVIK